MYMSTYNADMFANHQLRNVHNVNNKNTAIIIIKIQTVKVKDN